MEIKYNKGYDIEIINNNGEIVIIYNHEILKQYKKKSSSGREYYIVNVPGHGENYVHILVAYAYNTEEYYKAHKLYKNPVVDHIDNNPLNNDPKNLQYLSQSLNISKNPRK